MAQAIATLGVMAEVFALDALVDSSKAARALGWRPRHPGFLADVATYLAAWRARQAAAASPVTQPRAA